MSISETDFIEVPPPLFKYGGEKIIHDDNLAILSVFEDATILSNKEVKSLKKELDALKKHLNQHHVDEHLQKLDSIQQEYNSLKIKYGILKRLYGELNIIYEEQDDLKFFAAIIGIRLIKAIHRVRHQLSKFRVYGQKIIKYLSRHRDRIIRRSQIHQILQSHYAALDDQRKTELLQKGMAEEARLIIGQITKTLARLGFAHTYSHGNKSRTDYVKFDHVVATPDQLQCKIFASKQGLWGGSMDMLPQGVYVTELIKSKVMEELSVSLEREVWSPHTSEEKIPLVNGAWIIVERLGLVEGIPKQVTYSQLMARYETADHNKFPIPAGLRRGRRVNWVHLDSPSGIHLMFTGISGSGKSNAMRAMVSCIVEKQAPSDINFVFVDLKKQGDFREFSEAPHCVSLDGKGILTEINQVVEILQRVRAEMHMRQQRIGHIANNLIDYNKRVQPEHRMPRICIVFDEYGNTRRTRFSEEANVIDDICIEIGQVGRAAGISLWIGIQQPRRDNMPSSLRDNITTQFVGHQANVGAAQSATGNRESLKLEDFPGRMSANVGWKTEKVQMPFISEDDVKVAVQTAIDNYGTINPYQLMNELDDTDTYKPLTNEEIVLNTAFNEFNGDLRVYPMWQLLNGQISRPEITRIVKRFVEEQPIEYQGTLYNLEKQPGNFYTLVPTGDSTSEGADEGQVAVN
jgi:hypothetical protein